ncbi:hypothetical protein [Coprobacillus cateniformis]|uniref:hypothetical protein n=1 Tax=Coprobacillaceae TaxID=2810280 RepID=UPI0039A27A22
MICYPMISNKNITIFEKDSKIFLKSRYLPYRDILLNETSLLILNECLKSSDSNKIKNKIMSLYNCTNEKQVEKDIEFVLKTFSNLGILEWANEYNPFAKEITNLDRYLIKKCNASDAKKVFNNVGLNFINVISAKYSMLTNIDNLIYAIMIGKFQLYEIYDENNKIIFRICLERQIYDSILSVLSISWADSINSETIKKFIELIIHYFSQEFNILISNINEVGLIIKCLENNSLKKLKEVGFDCIGTLFDETTDNVQCLLNKVKL